MNRLSNELTTATRRRRGISLVEVMIAMVVLSFGLLGVAALQVRAITEGSGGQHLSDAGAIARNRVEVLNRSDWSAAVLTDTAGAWTAPVNFVRPDITYSQSERITNDALTHAATTIKSIEVQVTWSDSKRQNRQIVLSSARLREVNE